MSLIKVVKTWISSKLHSLGARLNPIPKVESTIVYLEQHAKKLEQDAITHATEMAKHDLLIAESIAKKAFSSAQLDRAKTIASNIRGAIGAVKKEI